MSVWPGNVLPENKAEPKVIERKGVLFHYWHINIQISQFLSLCLSFPFASSGFFRDSKKKRNWQTKKKKKFWVRLALPLLYDLPLLNSSWSGAHQHSHPTLHWGILCWDLWRNNYIHINNYILNPTPPTTIRSTYLINVRLEKNGLVMKGKKCLVKAIVPTKIIIFS